MRITKSHRFRILMGILLFFLTSTFLYPTNLLATDSTDSKIISIAAGDNFNLALNNIGDVVGWGNNSFGQIGDGTPVYDTIPWNSADPNTRKLKPTYVKDLGDIIAISAGTSHVLALKSDGTVWSWGRDYLGQLGVGNPNVGKDKLIPYPSQVKNLKDVIAIAAGDNSMALKNDGTVWTWGSNAGGQLGDGTSPATLGKSLPTQVKNLSGIVDISAGIGHCMALKNDGTVWCWGDNRYGALGDGNSTGAGLPNCFSTVPVQAKKLTDVVAIAAGYDHSLALKRDGTVWAWGYNFLGRLGLGEEVISNYYPFKNAIIPHKIPGLNNIIAIAAGSKHSLALAQNGSLWAWGDNRIGQLGNGDSGIHASKPSPIHLTTINDVKAIEAGGNHNLALKNDGSLWVWGNGSAGQLGNGSHGYDQKTGFIVKKVIQAYPIQVIIN